MNSSELEHHGVKGMHWGVRRYQNKDGSLTAAGKKRRRSDSDGEKRGLFGRKAKAESKGAPESTTKKAKEPAKKKISEMTDDELKAKVARLQLEKQALDLDKQVAALNPKKVSRGQKFVQHVGGKVIGPAATEAARSSMTKYLTKTMSNALGVSEKDTKNSLAALEKDFKIKNFRKQIHELEKYFDDEKRAGRPVT